MTIDGYVRSNFLSLPKGAAVSLLGYGLWVGKEGLREVFNWIALSAEDGFRAMTTDGRMCGGYTELVEGQPSAGSRFNFLQTTS